MNGLRKENSAFFLFLVLGFLVFFAQTKDFKLLMDGLTYAALSKNILKTGDWKTLHYGVEQYANFYQHPPLAMWIQALVYKVFGFSEAISRYFPSFCALGTLLCVFSYVKKRYSEAGAFFAALTLLSSTRYVKWATNFYLDGIFVFFCFAGFLLWMKNLNAEKKNNFASIAAGILFAFAFMTKGILIFGPLCVVAGSLVLYRDLKNLKQLLLFLTGAAIPLVLWVAFAGGDIYLDRYFHDSVFTRVGGASGLSPHPWRNIFLLWWPWWPVFLFTLLKIIPFDREKALFALAALSFPVGFTFNGTYMEHYLTPFYPFAAVVVGIQFSKWVPVISERWMTRMWILAGVVGVYLATVSPSVNQMKETPVREWVNQLEHLPKESKKEIEQIVFTNKSADIWYGMANILGKTDWQAIGDFALNRPATGHSILITSDTETPDSAWQIAPCLQVRGFHFYSSPDLKVCSQ